MRSKLLDFCRPVRVAAPALLLIWIGARSVSSTESPSPSAPPQTGSASHAAPTATGPAQATVNPHWSADGCRSCHALEEGRALPIVAEQVDAVCLGCHDGKKAKREAHPLGRTFANHQIVQPEGWPTISGAIVCSTCHDMIRACDPQRRRPQDNPAFLRGFESRRLLDFCAHCHLDLEAHRPYNPHRMLNEDGSTLRRSCQFCHHALLEERGRLIREGEPALRADPVTLCLGCHQRHVDFFEPGHPSIKVPPRMKAYMVAVEETPPGSPIPPERVEDALRAGREPTRLPLSDGQTVVCSTCHNPHEEGVFPSESVLAIGAISPGQERTRVRLRAGGKEFCLACHDK